MESEIRKYSPEAFQEERKLWRDFFNSPRKPKQGVWPETGPKKVTFLIEPDQIEPDSSSWPPHVDFKKVDFNQPLTVQKIYRPISSDETTDTTKKKLAPSDDFRRFKYKDVEFQFTYQQSLIVKELWENFEKGNEVGLYFRTVIKTANKKIAERNKLLPSNEQQESSIPVKKKMLQIFENHPNWKKLIEQVGRGYYKWIK